MGLRALAPAFSKKTTRSNCDYRLNRMKSFAQGIRGWIKQGTDTILLVTMQERPSDIAGTNTATENNE